MAVPDTAIPVSGQLKHWSVGHTVGFANTSHDSAERAVDPRVEPGDDGNGLIIWEKIGARCGAFAGTTCVPQKSSSQDESDSERP